ncbi:MAG: polysaccharide deacetylase family protein [Endomicrobia bacterium]|nr:polysaccharide deacetylase family protein [Endomicrobiia bacterium]
MIIRRFHIITLIVIFFTFIPIKNIYEEKIPQNFSLNSEEKKKLVCLTFDDGPHPYYTKKIVDILKEYDVKATFFLVGKQMKKHPDLVKYILSYPKIKIANHTYSHKNLTKLSIEEIKNEIDLTHKILLNLSEDAKSNIVFYIRPPGGNYNHKVLQQIEILGYKLALWSVFPDDLVCKSKQEILKKIDEQSQSDNEIVLLHSGNQFTLEALPEIIEILKAKNYEFVNIDEIKYETNNVN